MFKVFATDVIVSKGYANQSAVRFSEDGKIVRFRIGKKVYDKNAENNTRWFNVSVKGFGPIAERIQKMQLKEGSLIHISGTLDEESWLDQASNTTKTQTVIIIDDIDYASGEECEATAEVDMESLEAFRKKFPVLNDADI